MLHMLRILHILYLLYIQTLYSFQSIAGYQVDGADSVSCLRSQGGSLAMWSAKIPTCRSKTYRDQFLVSCRAGPSGQRYYSGTRSIIRSIAVNFYSITSKQFLIQNCGHRSGCSIKTYHSSNVKIPRCWPPLIS